MTVRNTARRFGSGTAALYRRYAEWLVSISWKRFIVLSILFMIAMGVLSDLPPFSWDLVPAKMEATGPLHSSSGGTDVTVDDHGVQIRRNADPATDHSASADNGIACGSACAGLLDVSKAVGGPATAAPSGTATTGTSGNLLGSLLGLLGL